MATQRQMEMEARLPEASPNLCKYLWDSLGQAGVPITADTVRFVGRLVSNYIKNTEEGKTTVFALLKAELSPAAPNKTYFQAGKEGEDSGIIPHKDLVEYKGWIYKRSVAVPHSLVSVFNTPNTVGCEDCGIMGPKDYCVTEVVNRTPSGKEAVESLCNHCRTFNVNPKVRDTASKRDCETCPMTGCDHYPKKQLALLPAPKRA
jgi:hypothetical protein